MDTMDDLVVNAASSSESHESDRSTSQGVTRPRQTTKQSTKHATPVSSSKLSSSRKNPLYVASPPILNPFNMLSALVPSSMTTTMTSNSHNKSNSDRSVNSSATASSDDVNDNHNNRRRRNTPTKKAAAVAPTTPATADIEASKYDHDVQQAKLMQQGIAARRRQQQQQQQQHRTNANVDPRQITEADVRLGLEGLDEADHLRSNGRLGEALKVSELALELLIKFLRVEEVSSTAGGGQMISRDAVEARVLVGLTAAEEMKAELRRQGAGGGDTTQPPATTTTANTANAAVSSLSNSLRAALGRGNGGSAPAAAAAAAAANPASTTNRQAAGQTTSSLPGSGRKLSPTRGGSTTPRYQSSTAASRKQATISSKSSSSSTPMAGSGGSDGRFLNSQDPLVQTVKSELYIDQSQLQSTTWDDIAGLEDAKQALQEAAILPLLRPDLFSGLRRPRNILLYGPPGTGKTLLVRAIAHESKCLLFICTASSLTSKWHGEGEKLLKTLFEVARQAAPSIIFVDEMDALLSKRKTDGEHEASRRFKTEFLTQMDGIVKKGGGGCVSGDRGADVHKQKQQEKNLLVLGATNTPWDIDDAVLRRFPRRIYIPLPDAETRTALLSKLLESGDASNHRLSNKDTKAIVHRLSGFSGSDIASIASEASFGPIRSLGGLDAIKSARSGDIRPIERQDFDNAIDGATKSVSKSLLKQYETWKSEQQASA